MPLTRELFDTEFEVDTPERAALVERVTARYSRWRRQHPGQTAEQYLGDVDGSVEWNEAVTCMSLRLVLGHGRIGRAGARVSIQQHQLTRADRCPAHVQFWDAFWETDRDRFEVSVVHHELMRCERIRWQVSLRIPASSRGRQPSHLSMANWKSAVLAK